MLAGNELDRAALKCHGATGAPAGEMPVILWHRHGELAQVKALAEKLDKVLEAHFRFEEQQLAGIGYTKLSEHRSEHKVMLDELQLIRGRLREPAGDSVRGD